MAVYLEFGEAIRMTICGYWYSLHCYQNRHNDEGTLMNDGKVNIFLNGTLKMLYEIDEEGGQVEIFI